jgi:hypothetical protein
MLLRHASQATHERIINAAAFVLCPMNLMAGFLQPASPLLHPMYAYAFDQAERAAAQRAFQWPSAPHLNPN